VTNECPFKRSVRVAVNTDNCQAKRIYHDLINSDACEVCREVKNILDRIQLISNLDAEQIFDIRVILCELLQNAIEHGNECDLAKKIYVDVWFQENNDLLGITVKDQGCGFNTLKAMNFSFTSASGFDPANINESGRGLFIVQNLCDFMEFNTMGNAITVKKKLNSIKK